MVPGMTGLYRLVQAGWGGVEAGWVRAARQGRAGWRSIWYGQPGQVHQVVPAVNIPINGSLPLCVCVCALGGVI